MEMKVGRQQLQIFENIIECENVVLAMPPNPWLLFKIIL
jgi:hypothetical protein